jgi:hypothetical protein
MQRSIMCAMSMLPDDTYDAFIIDARAHDGADDADARAMQLDLTITSGAHKGDVVSVRATGIDRDEIALIGMPATLRVEGGTPTVTFEE